jgi:hypothetical protein
MTVRNDDADIDVATVGKAMYEKLRSRLEATEKGKLVVIDVNSGDYEIAWRQADARQRLMERRPGAITYAERVGYPTAYKMGLSSWARIND